ncbi:MAG: hypothetical protein KC544_13640 [Gemmatimonadetes bacterium]|nr:hypothetical protein [Gemmatimonadota bacterium]
MFTSRTRPALRLLSALTLLAACGSGNGPEPGGTGTFTAVVSAPGKDPVTITGDAPSLGNRGDSNWYTHMVSPDGNSSFRIFFSGAERPAVGEYQMVNFVETDATPPVGQFVATGGTDQASLQGIALASISGTVTITSSSSTSIVGTFRYQAGAFGPGVGTVVEGQFATNNTER